MKAFKTADWMLQLALIVSGSLLIVFRSKIYYYADPISTTYFCVGGWQIVSVFVHLFFSATVKIKMRKVYLILLGLTILTGTIFLLMGNDYQLWFLIGLLFWSPVLAIIYLITSIIETKKMKAILS